MTRKTYMHHVSKKMALRVTYGQMFWLLQGGSVQGLLKDVLIATRKAGVYGYGRKNFALQHATCNNHF